MLVPLRVAYFAVRQLSNADYTIATKISEDVATFVPWALDHGYYHAADQAILLLQAFDSLGGIWIS